MSPLHTADEIDALEVEIDKLETAQVTARRTADELIDDDLAFALAEAESMMIRLRLEHRYRQYFKLAKTARAGKCPIHPDDALIVACPDCCRAWDFKPVGEVVPLDRGLELSSRLADQAKAVGAEPRQAFAIVRWISELTDDERAMLVRTAKRVQKRTG